MEQQFKASTATMGTITTATAHDANDFVGTDHTPITFEECSRFIGGSGLIQSALFVDRDKQSKTGELWIFNFPILTLPDDHAAFSVTTAEMMSYFVGVLSFVTYYAGALNSIALAVPTYPLRFKCAETSRSLYGALVTRSNPNYATTIPCFTLNILQD
jgi:hypothetical protein